MSGNVAEYDPDDDPSNGKIPWECCQCGHENQGDAKICGNCGHECCIDSDDDEGCTWL